MFRYPACLALLASASPYGHGEVSLPRLFRDHMVLQRNKPIPI